MSISKLIVISEVSNLTLAFRRAIMATLTKLFSGRYQTWLAAAGVILTAALVCPQGLAQSSRPAPAPAMVAQPFEAVPAQAGKPVLPAATAPAVSGAAPAAGTATTKPSGIMFQFDGLPYNTVVRRFAESAGRPIIGDLSIDGTLTFYDSQPYSYQEALDTLNIILGMKGYVLMESGRFFRLVALSDIQQMQLPILHGLDKTQDARPEEIVTVVLPLKYLDPDTASKAVVRMVSGYGSIMPLTKGKGLIITDRLSSIKRINGLLAEMDTTELGVDRQLKSYPLKHASAASVAAIVNNLFGLSANKAKKMIYNPDTRRYEPASGDVQETSVSAIADERTNTVMLLAGGEQLALIEQMIVRLDSSVDGPAAGDLRIFELKSARADELAVTINASLPQPKSNDRGQKESEARVVADAATNRIVVSAPADQMANVEKLIKELDAAVTVQSGARIFALKVADAQQLVPVVAAYAKRDNKGRSQLNVTADARTNSLVVVGSAGEIQQIAALLAELDRERPKDQVAHEIHVCQLKAGDSRQMREAITNIFTQAAGAGGPKATSLRVESEATTNSLIISCAPGDWPEIQKILDQVKASVEPMVTPTTRLIALKHAKAVELADSLRPLFAQPRMRPGQNTPSVPVVISPSDRANSLLVSAADDDFQTISEMVKSMDVESLEKVDPVTIVRLEAADAQKLAESLRAMLPPTPKGPVISIQADAATNSVLIRAPQAHLEMLQTMIAQLDRETQAAARDTRLINLQHASASGLAAMLNTLYIAPAQQRPRPGQQGSEQIIITSAPGDKTLIIDAPKSKADEIARIVQTLDTDDSPGTVQVRSYAIEASSAPELARSLERLFAQSAPKTAQPDKEIQPHFEADSASNHIIVAATAAQFVTIEGLIKDIKAKAELAHQTKIYPLHFAKCEDVCALLTPLLTDGPAKLNRVNAVDTSARVGAMKAGNCIVIQGPADKIALAEELLARFDCKDAACLKTAIELVQLKNAQAGTLAQSVNQSLAARQGADTKPEEVVTVTAEVNSNNVLIRGPERDLPAVIEMIKKLDADSILNVAAQVKVFPLKNGQAADLAKSLDTLFRDIIRQQSQGRPEKAASFSVAADARTNSLVVSTSAAHFAIVEEILKNLDQAPTATQREAEFLILQNADASDVLAKLLAVFKDKADKADKPVIEADTYANSLTVIAKAEDLNTIRGIVEKLDKTNREVKVRVVPLTQVKADKMAEMLQRVYGQMTDSRVIVTGGTDVGPADSGGASVFSPAVVVAQPFQAVPAQAGKPVPPTTTAPAIAPASGTGVPPARPGVADVPSARQAGVSPASEPSTRGAPTEPPGEPQPQPVAAADADKRPTVTIAVDKTSNSLILSGSRRELENMESLIAQLTATAARGEAEYRAFKIATADPQSVAQTLDELFNPKITVQPAKPDQPLPPLPPPAITVVADTRTRSVIVRAKPADFEIIEPLIKHLDQVSIVTSEVKVFALKNTDAAGVARNLQELFSPAGGPANGPPPNQQQSPQQRRRGEVRQMLEMQGKDGAKQVDVSTAVSIAANKQTNSVVVAASADAMELITRLIQELDQSAALSKLSTVRLYPLKNADVRTTVSALQQIFTPNPNRRDAQPTYYFGPAPAPAPVEKETPTVITGDESGRVIIVSAPQDAQDIIAKVINDIDAAGGGEAVAVQVYRVANADAASVAAALGQTMSSDQRLTRTQGGASTLRITADASSNCLVVRASKDEHAKIAELLKSIDVSPSDKYAVQIIPLLAAQPEAVASILRNVFADGRGTRQKPGAGGIVIEADNAGRCLTVRADEAVFAKISQLAKQLDASAPQGIATQSVFPLENAQAMTVAAALSQAFALPRGQKIDTDDMVIVVGEPLSNSVIVTANKANMDKVTSLLAKLDTKSPAGVRNEFLVLKNARAVDLAAVLSKVAANAPKAGKNPQQAQLVVTGDAASNALVMSGPAGDLDAMIKMATDLDKAAIPPGALTAIVPLKNAQAASLAPAVSQAYAQRGPKQAPEDAVIVVAEPFTNSVIVTASQQNMQKVKDLVLELDKDSSAGTKTEFLVLKNAKAPDMAAVLSKAAAAGQPGKGYGQPLVTISGDGGTNALLFSGPAAEIEKYKKIATDLDAAAVDSANSVAIVVLKNAQASSVAPALTAAFAPKGQKVKPEETVTVVAEPFSNSLIISASGPNQDRVKSLATALDQDNTTGQKIDFVILKNNKSTDLAPVLARTAATLSQQGKPNAPPPVTITGDAASNAIVMSGPAKDLENFRKMILQLDDAAASTEQETYIIPLKSGDATSVAAMIHNLYQQQLANAQRDRQTIKPLAVTVDERANTIILVAPKETYQEVLKWVKQCEDMKPTRGTLRLITVQQADPVEVDKAIQQLFNGSSSGAKPQPGPQGTATGKAVETSVLPKQRAIMVTASDDDFKAIQEIVKVLEETASKAKNEMRVFALKNAGNTIVAAALNQMYRTTQRSQTTPEEMIVVTALPQTMAVVVTAPRERMEDVAHLIEQIDKEEVAPQIEFRVYALANTLPSKIVPTMRPLLQEILRARPDMPINIQADDRTRSIIVSARGNVFEQVEKIIKGLDQPPANASAEVLIVPLKHADAARLAQVLSDMLKPMADGQVTPEAKSLQEQVRILHVKSAVADEVPELDLTKPIKITPDPAQPQGSNALVVTSTASNLKAMRVIIQMLDTVPLSEGSLVRVRQLKNADAASVQTILREMFAQGKQLAGKPGTSVAGRAEPDSESGKGLVNVLNVSADLRTNSLILSGVEESLTLAEAIITKLDEVSGVIVTEVRAFRLKYADAARLAPQLQAVFMEGNPVPGAEGLKTQVSRLRTVLDKQSPKEPAKEGHTSEQPKTRQAVTIQPDGGTNILLVAARSDIMPLIVDIIDTVDVPGAGAMNTVRIFPLANADATRLSNVITGLYTGPNAKFVRDEDKPTISVDTRTNALVVAASDKTFAMIDVMLKSLDSKTPIDMKDIRLVPLQNADAGTLAATLQKMMDARVQRLSTMGAKDSEALRVLVLSDPRSNSLIVGASAEGYELVKSLAGQLDSASPALSGQIQLMPLANANAGSLALTLTNLFTQRYAAARTQDVQRQKPVILPDLRTNSLLVAATQDDSKLLQNLLEKLDVKLSDPSVQMIIYPLKFNDAGIAGPTIQSLFAARLTSMTPQGQTPSPQDRVDIAIDAITNSIIVSASKENQSLIKGLLDKLDAEPPSETGVVKLITLNFADAPTVAAMLQGLITKGLYKPGIMAGGNNQILAAREKVSIAADPRCNVLIVSASKENMAIIEQIVKRIDMDVPPLLGDIRIYALKKADCTKLGPILQQFYTQKRTAEQAVNNVVRSVPVVVVPDPRTNTIIVAGGRENFAAIEEMLKQLDGDDMPSICEFEVFYLKQATAAALEPMLTQLFNNRVVRNATKDPMTVIADVKSNSLIVGASIEDMKYARTLIARLDVGVDKEGKTVHVFPLAKAEATQAVITLRTLFSGGGTGAAGSGSTSTGIGAGISMSADERTNCIIAIAGPADAERIGDLVRQIDTDTLARVTEIKIIQLNNADATDLAKILTDALTTKPKSVITTTSNRQSLLQFITHLPDGRDIVASALQEGVLFTPDQRTNSLVVSAPASNMPLLESLIKSLDTTNPRLAEIRVFTLVNADVQSMANVLTQMFRLQNKNGSGNVSGSGATGATGNANTTRAVNYTLVTTQPSGAKDSTSATIGTAEDYALSVTVDMRTNSVLVGGTTQYVDLASQIIKELDASPALERQTEVYHLRNARASDVQVAMRAFLDAERQRLLTDLGQNALGSVQKILEQDVAVVAVNVQGKPDNSNTLLLSACPRYFDKIADMIKELDQPPPQVLIQVLLAEVTLDDSTDLGIDWNYQKTVGKYSVSAGSSMGTQAAIAQSGGFNVSVTGGDISFFLQALQNTDKLQIISRPQILASDNQLASISVGQSVPFITDSETTDVGSQLNTITYKDVGIILNVTPRINPDGFVLLQVAPEVSSISTSTVTISSGITAPIIDSIKAQTTVTVQDGHTIVMGGLITTKDEKTEKKVPVLGDIPLLGCLFKYTTVEKQRTELLIIMTPTVLRSPGDGDKMTTEQMRRLKMLKEMTPEQLHELLNAGDSKANGAKSGQEKELQAGKEQPLSAPPATPAQGTPARPPQDQPAPAQSPGPSQSAPQARSAGPAIIPLEMLQPAATTMPVQ
jgi:type II secretion system protein D